MRHNNDKYNTSRPTPNTPWSFDPDIVWQKQNGETTKQMLDAIWRVSLAMLPANAQLFVADLPFYSKYKLVCLMATVEGEVRHCYVLRGPLTANLDGSSPPIHKVSVDDPIKITPDNAPCFIRFFCSYVYGDFGPFLPVESSEHLRMPDGLDANGRMHAQKCLDMLRATVAPIASLKNETGDETLYAAPIYYGGALFISKFRVNPSGYIEMLDDTPVVMDIPSGMVPNAAKAYKIQDLLTDDYDETLAKPYDVPSPIKSTNYAATPQASSTPTPVASGNQPKFSSDRTITHEYIATLTRNALANSNQYSVLADFGNIAKKDVLRDFCAYIIKHGLVVLIESDIPYIEELVADLLVGQMQDNQPRLRRIREENDIRDNSQTTIMLMAGDEANAPNTYGAPARNIERLAFEISNSSNPVLIGCNNPAGLNDALEKVVEFKLVIPQLTPHLFKQLFRKLFHGDLPRNWQKRGVQWLNYLTAHDFHQPCKAGLEGTKAFNYLHARVKERLSTIEVGNSPNLADLHGMAEAKQLAEDLIADIQSALKGQIPWSAVDKGILLSGPPGTGKTTLAKAIAKACGVRFIAVNAATWQSAGAMVEHLRAMRASFAEARRYAPSFLFIDEVDSFSNREHHTGQNATYNTEIVNALLAEIQGFDSRKPVFVIGATNFPHKVDPALRRAGRLDKLVYIPRPNVEALTNIYQYYLSDKTVTGALADDIDTKFLAGISFGLTGADVESLVRGAARRARKAQQPLCQQHLIDEITGKPRHMGDSNRLTAHEMRQIAVHEAGHALVQLLNNHQEIAYVSIVPRENGSLGFVASMPSASSTYTRRQYLDKLQVVLAGRAAEEIVFGKDNISGGAGGESTSSDLAIATGIASDIVSKMGMGKGAGLRWSPDIDEGMEDEIEKLLQEAYSGALAKLEAHRKSLDALTNALVDKQELMGNEIRKIINA